VINGALRETHAIKHFFAPFFVALLPMAILLNQVEYTNGRCLDKPFGTSLSLLGLVIIAILRGKAIWKPTAVFALCLVGILAYGILLRYEQPCVEVYLFYIPCLLLQVFIAMAVAHIFGSGAYPHNGEVTEGSRLSSLSSLSDPSAAPSV
jgi:hypothetical protein